MGVGPVPLATTGEDRAAAESSPEPEADLLPAHQVLTCGGTIGACLSEHTGLPVYLKRALRLCVESVSAALHLLKHS